ncbi:hypothetical protein LCGC14_0501240 [marine sediment metagenome]|uniref:Uncharacterized protein n=1 Tax=marine sediment metagenome TaxID=412755 RepID=A0A0F9S911_9ZZZZ
MKIKLQGFASDRSVLLNGVLLDPKKSQKIRNHSPDGFNWGYGGSGPAQLALAIYLELYGSQDKFPESYQDFKFREIGALPIGKDFDVEIELL